MTPETPTPPADLSTQQKVVFDYLAKGRTLTNVVALSCLGVGSLSSRIAELRKLGVPITDSTDVDRFERRFKKYRYGGLEPNHPANT